MADLVEKIALSHPEISIRLIVNNQNKLHTSGNHNLKDIIYTIYGREITANLIPLQVEHEIVRVTGVQYEVKERLLRSGESMFFRKEQAYEAFEEAEEILAAACTYRIGPCGCGQRRFRRDRYGECR